MLGSICWLLFQNTDRTSWSDEHTRGFLNNHNKKPEQQEKTPINCKLALERWMNSHISEYFFVPWTGAVSVTENRYLLQKLGNYFGYTERKHLPKTMERTLMPGATGLKQKKPYRVTKQPSAHLYWGFTNSNTIHLIHPSGSNVTFFLARFGWFFQGNQYLLTTRGGDIHALQ